MLRRNGCEENEVKSERNGGENDKEAKEGWIGLSVNANNKMSLYGIHKIKKYHQQIWWTRERANL